METRAIEVGNGTTRQPVQAQLQIGVDALTMVRAEKLWGPIRLETVERLLLAGQTQRLPEHVHWNWAIKATEMNKQRICCAVEVAGRIEGLMVLIVSGKKARLPNALGRQLIYVDYLETAPWNNPDFSTTPEFRGVGLRLIQAAVQYSVDSGLDGRMGLHSLPQAEGFYKTRCGLVSLGSDANYHGLVYLELEPTQVPILLGK